MSNDMERDFGTFSTFNYFYEHFLFPACLSCKPREPQLQDDDDYRAPSIVYATATMVITLIQAISMTIASPSTFHCNNSQYFGCVMHAIGFPIDIIGTQIIPPYYGAILSGALLLCCIASATVLLYRFHQKNSKTANKESPLEYVFPFLIGLYGVDHLVYWVGFFTFNDYPSARNRNDITDSRYVYLGLGLVVCLFVVLVQFAMAVTIPVSNLRNNTMGKQWSEKSEMFSLILKWLLVIQHTVQLAYEPTKVVSVIIRAIIFIWSVVTLIVHLLMNPYALQLENRYRSMVLGVIVGLGASSIVADVMSDPADFHFSYHIISGGLVGAVAFIITPWRRELALNEAKLAINACTESFDREYINDLLTIVWEEDALLYIDDKKTKKKKRRASTLVPMTPNGDPQPAGEDGQFLATPANGHRNSFLGSSLGIGQGLMLPTEEQKHEDERIKERLAMAKRRLLVYMSTQNFASLKRSLVFSSDIELFVRGACHEWEDYSETQKEVTRTAVTQAFVALLSQPNVANVTYLWFGVFCLYILNDPIACLRAVKTVSEKSNSVSTLFMCYTLQRTAEGVRASDDVKRSRQSGVTDYASWRRACGAAHTLHEKAISACRKFFRHLTHNHRRIYRSNDLVLISENTNLEDRALQALTDADESYKALIASFPLSEQVQLLEKTFNLQFFKDEFQLKRSSGLNPENANEGVLDTSISSKESLKQTRITDLRNIVHNAINKVRYMTFLSLLICAAMYIAFAVLTSNEVGKVPGYVSAFVDIANAFALIPSVCGAFKRATDGTLFTYDNKIALYLDDLKALQQNVNSLGAAGMSFTSSYVNNLQYCNNILDKSPYLLVCCVAFMENLQEPALTVFQLTDGSRVALPIVIVNDPEGDDTVWLAIQDFLRAYNSNQLNEGFWFSDFITYPGTEHDVLFTQLPVEFDGRLMGQVYTIMYPSEHEKPLQKIQDEVENSLEILQSSMASVADLVLKRDMREAYSLMFDPQFDVTYFSPTLGTSIKRSSMVEFLNSFQTAARAGVNTLKTFDGKQARSSADLHFVLQACYGGFVDDASRIAQVTLNYMNSSLDKSTRDLAIFAVVTYLCVIVACVITLRTVMALHMFDRSDARTAPQTILGKLPKYEIRKMGKLLTALRPNKGIFDPDDDQAGDVDLAQKVRIYSKKDSDDEDEVLTMDAPPSEDGDHNGGNETQNLRLRRQGDDQAGVNGHSHALDSLDSNGKSDSEDTNDLANPDEDDHKAEGSPRVKIAVVEAQKIIYDDYSSHVSTEHDPSIILDVWRTVRGFFRKELTVAVLFIWIVSAACVSLLLGMGISSLKSYPQLYSEMNEYFEVNLNHVQLAARIPFAISGPTFYPVLWDSLPPHADMLQSLLTSFDETRKFQAINNRLSGKSTVSRRFEGRKALMYEKKCIGTQQACTTRPKDLYFQSNEHLGFARAFSLSQKHLHDILVAQIPISPKSVSGIDSDLFYLFTIYQNDFSNAWTVLYADYIQECFSMVDIDSRVHYICMGVTLGVAVFLAFVSEVVLYRQRQQLDRVTMLLRWLPHRISSDYKLFELFGVAQEDYLEHYSVE